MTIAIIGGISAVGSSAHDRKRRDVAELGHIWSVFVVTWPRWTNDSMIDAPGGSGLMDWKLKSLASPRSRFYHYFPPTISSSLYPTTSKSPWLPAHFSFKFSALFPHSNPLAFSHHSIFLQPIQTEVCQQCMSASSPFDIFLEILPSCIDFSALLL